LRTRPRLGWRARGAARRGRAGEHTPQRDAEAGSAPTHRRRTARERSSRAGAAERREQDRRAHSAERRRSRVSTHTPPQRDAGAGLATHALWRAAGGGYAATRRCRATRERGWCAGAAERRGQDRRALRRATQEQGQHPHAAAERRGSGVGAQTLQSDGSRIGARTLQRDAGAGPVPTRGRRAASGRSWRTHTTERRGAWDVRRGAAMRGGWRDGRRDYAPGIPALASSTSRPGYS
jgi:hypothetical protein